MIPNFPYPPMLRQRILGWLTLGVSVWLTACSSAPVSAGGEPTDLRLKIVARANINPNKHGEAAPILVRVYELKATSAFTNADFFALQNDEKSAIGNDVLVVDEFILRPGDKREINRKSNRSTTSIGVFAGYRSLSQSVWRDVYQFPDGSDTNTWWSRDTQELVIQLDQHAVSISKSGPSQ